jgi:hypothetical protein
MLVSPAASQSGWACDSHAALQQHDRRCCCNTAMHRLQDPPTYTRFVKSLGPKPPSSPKQRRAAAEQRERLMEQRADVQLVQALPGRVS